jgi:peptidoglycan/LPS O-acetylase OafA/YrhL
VSSAHIAVTPSQTPAKFYRPELDVLRFGAFLLVFLHHALPHEASAYFVAGMPQPAALIVAGLARAAALGVDLFFALSAYLITELLLCENGFQGGIDIRRFYIRRILRIWPLYFAALLILAPAMSRLAGEHLPWSFTLAFGVFGGNWACAAWGYPSSSFALLWSVSIEEQFYLVWPWLAHLGATRLRRIAYGMLMVASASRMALVLRDVQHPGIWCNTLARLDPIAGGALLACFLKGSLPPLTTGSRVLSIGSGAVVLIASGAAGSNSGWPVLVTYPLVAGACIAIIAGVLGSPLRTGAYLGKISYGLYVFHAAVLRVVPSPALALPVTIGVAALSYRYLESPFLRLKKRFTQVSSRPV